MEQDDKVCRIKEIGIWKCERNDIENCIFISDSQENLNLAQNLNIKYAIKLNTDKNNKIQQ